MRGELGPGEQLVEADICEALGISRTPLREALKVLAAEGLVELRRNRSSIVAPLRREQLEELFEAVAGVERIAAELAAQRMTARDHEKLSKLQERMEGHYEAGEVREYFERNQQVHAFIVSCSHNGVLKATHDSLLIRAERARFLALSAVGRWDESVKEHRAVMAALAEGDGEAAGRLLAQHVLRTGEVVAQTFVGSVPQETGGAAVAAGGPGEP